MAVMNAVRNLQTQLRSHIALIPLVGCYVGAGVLAGGIMSYTSLAKADVVYNRWWNPTPHDRIVPTKVQQKLWATSVSRPAYQKDTVVEDLRKEIYSGQDWVREKGHH